MTLQRVSDRAPVAALGLASSAHTLRLDGLAKRYGHLAAVDGVSLDIPSGEFLTLLGPSGSGKTTLLMMIAGFVQPDSGELFVDDRCITGLAPERRNFGMVFQGYALFPHMSVAQNVAYPLQVRRMSRADIADKVRAALALVRLQGFADRLPRQLSGGQQQRVAIARALVYQPDILLLDEPLGALDRQLRAEVQIELKALHAELGTTFVYVTHDQDEALSMSDRVAILHRGRLVQAGTPAELYERPRSRFVAGFLGTSNFLTAAGPGAVPAVLALRPERVRVSLLEPLDTPDRAPGRIVALAYLGATLQLVVDTDRFGEIIAAGFAYAMPAGIGPGVPVWVGWDADATTPVVDDGAD